VGRRPEWAVGTVKVMSSLAQRPFVFLDVDGPLIPFRARPVTEGRRSGGRGTGPHGEGGNPLLDRLDPEDGRQLLALKCPLVWATSWMSEANEVVAPRLGLPELPVVQWPDTDDQTVPGLHWKTASLAAWAAGRPFVWLDDEITEADRRWVAAHHPVRALLHRVDPYVGLTAADFAQVRRWLDDGTGTS
jgi:HAD domain in Swiss Army Knife RNA repair proteins